MIDPMGISNWSVTFVDWSERRWHPKTYGGNEISLEFMKNVTVCFKTQSFRKMSQSTSYYTFLFSRLCSPRTWVYMSPVWGRYALVTLPCSLYSFSLTLIFLLVLLKHGDELHWPCTWNGIKRPCYLFARKFHPDTLDTLVNLFPNYTNTAVWERILEPNTHILGPNCVPNMSQRWIF